MLLKVSTSPRAPIDVPQSFRSFPSQAVMLCMGAFFLVSCVSGTDRPGHLWAELDDSADLECVLWPGNEDMGPVTDVFFRRSDSGELIASGTGFDRSGRPAMFESPASISSDTPAELTVYKTALPPRGKDDSGAFEGRKLNDSGGLNFKTKAPVESRAVLPLDTGFFVAAVTGDSLIGNAQIEVAYFRSGSTEPVWTYAAPHPHTHLGDPVLIPVKEPGKAFLLVPKWVDRETTIGTYRLSQERLEAQGNQGIFPEISTVVASGKTPRGAAIMVRGRDKDNWRFRLCEMKW